MSRMKPRIRAHASARYAGAAMTGALLVLLAGCGGAPAAEESPTRTPTTAAPAPTGPDAAACYSLALAAALEPTSDTEPVPCDGPHTTRTVYVGQIDPIVDGHLLAIDSARVQKQIATACRKRVDDHLGGTVETRRLSRFEATWFSPTLEQGDDGALWFRCDLLLVSGPETLGELPVRTRGVLKDPKSLDRYGTCGTASPAAEGFRRVACAAPHTWRARAAFDLPAGTTYLEKSATADADARCRDVTVDLTEDLKLRWSFEWPTKAQWDGGQRYGLCWTPDPA